jgi:hypothetical protein
MALFNNRCFDFRQRDYQLAIAGDGAVRDVIGNLLQVSCNNLTKHEQTSTNKPCQKKKKKNIIAHLVGKNKLGVAGDYDIARADAERDDRSQCRRRRVRRVARVVFFFFFFLFVCLFVCLFWRLSRATDV